MHAYLPFLYRRELSPYPIFLSPSFELSLMRTISLPKPNSHKVPIRADDGAELICADIILGFF